LVLRVKDAGGQMSEIGITLTTEQALMNLVPPNMRLPGRDPENT
jgi:hypothetical protein